MTHATPRQGKWFIDDDGYLCDEMGECIDLQTDAALIVHAVNTFDEAKAALKKLASESDVSPLMKPAWTYKREHEARLKYAKAVLAKLEGGAR